MQVRRSTIATALVVVFVLNLVVMGTGALCSYEQSPPIPREVVDERGETLVTADQVHGMKKQFQRHGLVNRGSVLGSGAYYGEDLTAWALDRKVATMRDYYTRGQYGSDYAALSDRERAAVAQTVEADLADVGGDEVVRYSAAEAAAHRQVREAFVARFHDGSPDHGVPAGMVATEVEGAVIEGTPWTTIERR